MPVGQSPIVEADLSRMLEAGAQEPSRCRIESIVARVKADQLFDGRLHVRRGDIVNDMDDLLILGRLG